MINSANCNISERIFEKLDFPTIIKNIEFIVIKRSAIKKILSGVFFVIFINLRTKFFPFKTNIVPIQRYKTIKKYK